MLVGDITYVHTREGFVYPAGREGAVCLKRIVGYATAGTHASRIGSKRPGEVAVRNCQPVKGVTFFMSSLGVAVHVRRVHRFHEQVWHPLLRWEERVCATYSAAADIIQRHPCRK